MGATITQRLWRNAPLIEATLKPRCIGLYNVRARRLLQVTPILA